MNSSFIIIMTILMLVLLASLILFVAVSMAKKSVKISFAFLCVSLSIWIVANTGADAAANTALWWTRLAFAGAALLLAALVIFVLWFPRKTSRSRYITVPLVILSLGMAILSFTNLLVPEVVYKDGYANVVVGQWYWLYVVYILVSLATAVILLVRRLKVETGMDRERVKYMLLGTAMTASIALLTNLFIPLLTGVNPLAIYGSLASLAFIATVAYSIIRHQLFSIRIATARAVAYLLSGVSLALFFGITIFWLDSMLFVDSKTATSQKIFYILSAVLIGFSFPPIKNFFNNLTRRIFLRDIYDPEVVLTKIASIASNTKSSTSLLKKVSGELLSELHLSFIEVYLFEGEKWVRKVSVGKSSDVSQISNISELLKTTNGTVISLEENDNDSRDDIGIVIILKTSQNVLGYMSVGYKQNGTTFTSNDKKLLEAVASEVAIATENLLRFEAIEQFNETLQQRVDEATDELRNTNKKLLLLDESKDEFISMASHQLRTPLTSVKGYISMMLDGDIGKITSEQRKVLEEAYGSSQRMVYLISDFLNVSRLQTGKFVIEKSNIQLPLIIADEIDQLRSTAKARNIVLNYTPPEQFPILSIDENKIRQVMMNFIDNAIYYSKSEGGIINVTLAKHSKHISFKVIDNGIGVPRDEQHRLFSKFYRASNAKKARPDGTGIGIFMAKKVIVAHGGAIVFESTEGKGSTFGFRLPIETIKSA